MLVVRADGVFTQSMAGFHLLPSNMCTLRAAFWVTRGRLSGLPGASSISGKRQSCWLLSPITLATSQSYTWFPLSQFQFTEKL